MAPAARHRAVTAELPVEPSAPRARLLFVVATAAGLLGFILSPWLQVKIGVTDLGRWFLDSYAVLAASDAVRAGIDPNGPNPLDVFGRPHSYSDWWYLLGDLGLNRSHNFRVGASWVALFLGMVWLTLRPRSYREALSYVLLVLSPPVLLMIVRANNDLVVFALLGLAGLALRRASSWRWWPAVFAIALAAGLKFYPIVAAFVFLLLRPARRMVVAVGSAALVLLVVLVNVWPALGRGVFKMPQALYTMGSAVFFRDLGWVGRGPVILGVALIGGAALWLMRAGKTTGLSDPAQPLERRVLFTLGAVTLLGCFLAGTSYAYRWVFGLWLAPWLWDEARAMAAPPMRRRVARLAGLLLVTVVWLDGIFCLVLNIVVESMLEAPREKLLLGWRLMTQPLTWALMALLAGWLLDAAFAAWRELRSARAKP